MDWKQITIISLIAALAFVAGFEARGLVAPDAEEGRVSLVGKWEKPTSTVKIGDRTVTVPRGSTVTYRVRNTTPLDEQSKIKDRIIRSKGKSVGLRTRESGIASQIDYTAPVAHTNGEATASGGDFSFGLKGMAGSSGALVLYAIGGILILAGVALAVFLKKIGTGLLLAGAGIAIIAIGIFLETYTWVLWVFLAIAVVAAVLYVLSTRKGKQIADALLGVIKGVEVAKVTDPAAAAAVTNSIDSQDTGEVKPTVSRVKAANADEIAKIKATAAVVPKP